MVPSANCCEKEVRILHGSIRLITRSVIFFCPSLLTIPRRRVKKPMAIREKIMNCSFNSAAIGGSFPDSYQICSLTPGCKCCPDQSAK
jgi:hypothetical protein